MASPFILVLKSPVIVTILTVLPFLSVAWAQAGGQGAITIDIIEGQNAINNITRNTAYEPVIEVRDASGKPVEGANVTFSLPAVGPSGVFTDGSKTLMIQTDATGRASARGLRPNNQVGQFDLRITASARGQNATATVTQTNAAPVVSSERSGKKLAIILGLLGGGAAAVALAVGGGGGGNSSPQPGAPTPIPGSVTPGAPGFGPPR